MRRLSLNLAWSSAKELPSIADTIGQRFARATARRPEATALLLDARTVSYGELVNRLQRLHPTSSCPRKRVTMSLASRLEVSRMRSALLTDLITDKGQFR
jgi:hypothetical protein